MVAKKLLCGRLCTALGGRAITALREVFPRYDVPELRTALFALTDPFRDVATETAARLGIPNPHEGETLATTWIRKNLAALA